MVGFESPSLHKRKKQRNMEYKLRDYQQEAVNRALQFFRTGRGNAIMVLPTGSGKSVVIASIAKELGEPIVIFQPNKEILEQNYEKFCAVSKNAGAGVYSASAGRKEMCMVTFATIGSVKGCKSRFARYRYCIIDECHNVNPQGGMYRDFIQYTGCRVLGLTATPYRLTSSLLYGSMLKFLTRVRDRVFDSMIYCVQIKTLSERGFLAPINYYSLNVVDQKRLKLNSTGMDFDEVSVKAYYQKVRFSERLLGVVKRLLATGRTNILVFTQYTDEASRLVNSLDGLAAIVTGGTKKAERERILNRFKEGKINVVANVGVLTTGFDYPELATVVLARPTMSLALYYQMVGRCIRPHEGKRAWLVDLCGNCNRFGMVEDLVITERRPRMYAVESKGKQLTNVYFGKHGQG